MGAPGQRVEFGAVSGTMNFDQDGRELRMCVDRRHGDNIGMYVAPLRDKTLMVVAIHPGGLAEDFNRWKINLQDMLRPGLRIIDVNGRSGTAFEMVSELRKRQVVHIVLQCDMEDSTRLASSSEVVLTF